MDDSLFSLSGKVAVVTGASYGLGVTFARALAEAGADIVATARSADKLDGTRALIESLGRKCLAVGCDVTRYEDVENLMRTAWERFGTVHVLVNNAGIADPRGLRSEHSEPEMFEKLIRTDLIGVWYCCRAAAHHMLRQGHGNIINISSIAGCGGFELRIPGYFAAKGGVNNLTRQLACEWGDRGIRVNALAPHFFDTEMTHEFLAGSGMLQMLEDRTPLRRIGRVQDLAGPIVFLASDASQFISGVVLPIDGGLTAGMGCQAGPYPSDNWDPEGRGHPITPVLGE